MAGVEGLLEGFLDELRGRWLRGLVVLHSSPVGDAVELLGRAMLQRGSCLLVAPRGVEAPSGCAAAGPGSLQRILGSEHDYVVVASPGLLRPNVLAAAAGAVRGGGALAFAVPPLEEWSPGPLGGSGGWKRYLVESIAEAEPLLWAELPGRVLLHRPPRGRGRRPSPPEGAKGLPGRLRGLAGAAATRGQLELLREGLRLLRGGARSLLALGDRGRGKSYALGLLLAAAAALAAVPEAMVVAPDPCSLGSLWRGLREGLSRLGLRARIVERRGCVEAVKGPWFRFGYVSPEEAGPSSLLVVDEAAAVGVARLRRLSWRSGRVVAATTIHGYEGGGLALARMAEDVLPRPLVRVELREPVRYAENDPLEEWSFRVFGLRAETSWEPGRGPYRYSRLSPGELARDPGAVRMVYSLLAAAHYMTEPDYLLVLLESRSHTVHLLLDEEGRPVAAADAAVEEPGAEEPARLGLKLLWLASGREAGFRAARIVRIAVHPGLQRRGLGSRLLRAVEEWARSEAAAEAVLAVFGRHDVLGFWHRMGYSVYYVSPRFNRYTGEKNIAVGKPFSSRAAGLLAEAAGWTRLKLIHGGHVVYRDLAAEKIAEMLRHMPPAPVRLCGAPETTRLGLLGRGLVEHEQVIDLVYASVASRLASGPPPDGPCGAALVAHVVQGKPLHEAAEIAGLDVREAANCIREFVLGSRSG